MTLPECNARGWFHFAAIRASTHYREVRRNIIKETITFDQHTFTSDSRQCFVNAASYLTIFHNYPMHVGSAGVPEEAGIFSGLIVRFASRTNHRFVAK